MVFVPPRIHVYVILVILEQNVNILLATVLLLAQAKFVMEMVNVFQPKSVLAKTATLVNTAKNLLVLERQHLILKFVMEGEFVKVSTNANVPPLLQVQEFMDLNVKMFNVKEVQVVIIQKPIVECVLERVSVM